MTMVVKHKKRRGTGRRRALRMVGWIFLLIIGGRSFARSHGMDDDEIDYAFNPKLETIRVGWEGTPMVEGLFINEFTRDSHRFSSLFKWMTSRNPQHKIKKHCTFNLSVTRDTALFEKDNILVWLGHASFFIRFMGESFLLDPCLTGPPMVKRWTASPWKPRELPPVDYLLISHNHYDHLDEGTVRHLSVRKALLPLGMEEPVRRMGKKIKDTEEAGWYQRFHTAGDVEVVFLPSHHWSKRGLNDTNRILWGSFMLRSGRHSIYFAGDTAYSDHFKSIAEFAGTPTVCLLPVGAYEPDYMMRSSHMSPEEAVHAFNDLGGEVFVPMHFGTFDLADESPGDPHQRLTEMEENGKIEKRLHFVNPGEVVDLDELF